MGPISGVSLIDFVSALGVLVESGSALSAEGCTVLISGCDNISGVVNITQVAILDAEMKIYFSSTLSIVSHKVDISGSTFTDSIVINAIIASNVLTLGIDSSLAIQSCETKFHDDVIVSKSIELGGVLLRKGIAMTTSTSQVDIISNTFSLSAVSTTECTVEFINVVDAPTVYLHGSIRLNSNRVVMRGVRASTGAYAHLLSMKNSEVYFVPSYSTPTSIIQVSENVIDISISSADLAGIALRMLKFFPNGTSITNVSSNSFTLNASNIQSGFVVASEIEMFDTATTHINWNTLECGSQGYIFPANGNSRVVGLLSSKLLKSSASSLQLLHNSINGPNAYAISVATTSFLSRMVKTCRNYVNGSLCAVKNGMYACYKEATVTTIQFPDCHTDTTTLTPSPLTSTVSPVKTETQPHTLSSAHTPSSTIVHTPTQWSPTPLPPTRTHTLPRPITKTVPPTITRIPPLPSSSSDISTTSSTNPSTSSSSSASEATSITTGPPTAATSQMSSASSSASSSSASATTTVTNATALPSETSSTTITTTAPPIKLCNITCHHTAVYGHATDMVATSTADSLSLGAAVSAIAQAFKGGAALPPVGGGVCSKTTSVPFSDTQDGATTRRYILVHTNGGSSASLMNATAELANLGVNTSDVTVHISMAGVVASPSSPSTAVLYGVEIRRTTDENALGSVPFGITLPPSSFGCTPNAAIPSNGYPSAIAFKLDSPPSALSENEKVAVAVMAMAAADLQTLAAIGLLRCSPGASEDDEQSEANIRALVPVALSGTCAGAVQGALVLIVGVLVISVVLTLVLMRVKKVSWTEAATTSRCPGIVIVAWAFVQMGFVVCGGRLVSSSNAGDVGLGLVGMLLGLGLPVLCVFLAWGVVSRRCYRIAPKSANTFNDDPKKKRAPAVVRMVQRFMLPMYELDTKCIPICKAYSTVVGKTRRPSCIWAALPTIQPVIMAALAFSHGYVCSPLLVTTGVVMMLLAAVCYIVFRPHRIFTANFLQGIALILNSLVLMVAAKLVEAPLDITALSANRAISYIQMGLSVFRTVHTLGAAGYMHLRGAEVYERVSADGASLPPETPGVPALPEHVAQPVFEYIAPCLGGAGVLPPSNSNAYDSESIVKKPDGDLERGLLYVAAPDPPPPRPFNDDDDDDINITPVPSDVELDDFLNSSPPSGESVVEESATSSEMDDVEEEMHPPMNLPIGAPPTMDLLPHRGYVTMVRPYELIPEEMLVRVEGDQDDDGGGATTTTAAWIKYTSKEEEGEGAVVQPPGMRPLQ